MFKWDQNTLDGPIYKNKDNESILVSDLGDYFKRYSTRESFKLQAVNLNHQDHRKKVKFFLYINPEYTISGAKFKYTFDLYWASDYTDAGRLLNRKLSGIYYYGHPGYKNIESSFINALIELNIDKHAEVLQSIENALVDHASKVAEFSITIPLINYNELIRNNPTIDTVHQSFLKLQPLDNEIIIYYLGEFKTKSDDKFIKYFLEIIKDNIILRWSSNNSNLLDKQIANIIKKDNLLTTQFADYIFYMHEQSIVYEIRNRIISITNKI